MNNSLPIKQDFIDRKVSEPLAVRLAGEYDVWEDWRPEWQQGHLPFQFGLDSRVWLDWGLLLHASDGEYKKDDSEQYVFRLLEDGDVALRCYAKRDADVMCSRSFLVKWEGLKFLALNTARCNSNTFAARDVPETGHDALMAFYYNGKVWAVSLYHANHRKDIDLSKIAVKHKGGGHAGACGFTVPSLLTLNWKTL